MNLFIVITAGLLFSMNATSFVQFKSLWRIRRYITMPSWSSFSLESHTTLRRPRLWSKSEAFKIRKTLFAFVDRLHLYISGNHHPDYFNVVDTFARSLVSWPYLHSFFMPRRYDITTLTIMIYVVQISDLILIWLWLQCSSCCKCAFSKDPEKNQ